MAIAYDASSGIAVGTGDRNWTHTPSGTPRGIVVLIATESGSDMINGVTYGGVSMSEVALSPTLKLTGEAGGVYIYFLGSSIPTGAQTVAVDVSNATPDWCAAAYSVTAANDTEVHDTTRVTSDSLDDPTATLTITADSFVAGVISSGIGTVPGFLTAGSGTTITVEEDFGVTIGVVSRGTSIKTTDFGYQFVTSAADDVTMLAVAIRESAAAGQPMIRRFGLADRVGSLRPHGVNGVSIMRRREAFARRRSGLFVPSRLREAA